MVPTDFDIYNTRSWKQNALLQPESRMGFANLLAQGWTNALRHRFPEERIYTFGDYFRNHRQTNSGLRIDHLLLSPLLKPGLKTPAWTVTSGTHLTPVTMRSWIELSERTAKRQSSARNKAALKKKKRVSPR